MVHQGSSGNTYFETLFSVVSKMKHVRKSAKTSNVNGADKRTFDFDVFVLFDITCLEHQKRVLKKTYLWVPTQDWVPEMTTLERVWSGGGLGSAAGCNP